MRSVIHKKVFCVCLHLPVTASCSDAQEYKGDLWPNQASLAFTCAYQTNLLVTCLCLFDCATADYCKCNICTGMCMRMNNVCGKHIFQDSTSRFIVEHAVCKKSCIEDGL